MILIKIFIQKISQLKILSCESSQINHVKLIEQENLI